MVNVNVVHDTGLLFQVHETIQILLFSLLAFSISLSLSIYLYIYLSIFLSLFLSLSIYLSTYLYLSLALSLPLRVLLWRYKRQHLQGPFSFNNPFVLVLIIRQKETLQHWVGRLEGRVGGEEGVGINGAGSAVATRVGVADFELALSNDLCQTIRGLSRFI